MIKDVVPSGHVFGKSSYNPGVKPCISHLGTVVVSSTLVGVYIYTFVSFHSGQPHRLFHRNLILELNQKKISDDYWRILQTDPVLLCFFNFTFHTCSDEE